MAKYLLSVHYVEGQPVPDADTMQRMGEDVEALNSKMRADGVWVFAGGLQEPQQATVVEDRDGSIVTTDGPFPEAKEHLGGFWVVEVVDQDAALDWAGQATRACRGPVEVRPFHPDE